MEQEKMTGRERAGVLYMAALDDQLQKAGPVLRERLRSASPTAWRDWRLAQRLVTKTINAVVDTLPDKDIRWLAHNLEHGTLQVVLPGVVKRADYAIVEESDLRALGLAAMRNECRYCMKTPVEAKRCKLHKVLEWVAPMPERPRNELSLCAYAEVTYPEQEATT